MHGLSLVEAQRGATKRRTFRNSRSTATVRLPLCRETAQNRPLPIDRGGPRPGRTDRGGQDTPRDTPADQVTKVRRDPARHASLQPFSRVCGRRATIARRRHQLTINATTRAPNAQRAACRYARTWNQHVPCDIWGVERYDECAQHTVPPMLHTGSRPALSRMHTMHAHMNSHTDCRVTTRALFSCSTITPLHPLHRMEASFRTWGTWGAFIAATCATPRN